MEHLGVNELTKSKSKKYMCEICDYSTSQKANYEKHLLTGKHVKRATAVRSPHNCTCGKVFTRSDSLFRHKKHCEVANNSTAKVTKVTELLPNAPKQHICECGAIFTRNGNLKRHKKICLHGVVVRQPVDNTKVLNALTGLKEDNKMLHEDNKILKEKLNQLESGVLTAVAEPKVINNNINITILLNEKCGDAMAIQDFAKTLMICMEDVNYALENGKVKGIENIIQKKFDELGVHKRPLHCTDVKRGTLYVKGDEGWEKEKGEMNKMIRDVECVQTTGIKVWSEANPEYSQGNQKLMEKWLRIVQCLTNSIDGIGVRKIEKRCQEMSKLTQEELV